MKHLTNKAAAAFTEYIQELPNDFMDIEVPCNAANFIPSLIEEIEKQQQEIKQLKEMHECSYTLTKSQNVRIGEHLKEIQQQQQEIKGLEEQAGEMAEKHAEKDIIMGNMQQEIERYKRALELIIENTVSGHVENIAKRALGKLHHQ